RHRPSIAKASMSSPRWSRRMAARRPRRCSPGSKSSRARASNTRAIACRRWTSTASPHAGRSWRWSTSSPTPTRPAETGGAALDGLRRRAANVLLLDLGLPDIDGLDIIAQLRGEGSAMPIVVLSSRSDEIGKVRALDLGADDYVTKPFGID